MSLDVARITRRLAKERKCWAAGGSAAADQPELAALPHGCAQLIEEADPSRPGARLLTFSPGWEKTLVPRREIFYYKALIKNLVACLSSRSELARNSLQLTTYFIKHAVTLLCQP